MIERIKKTKWKLHENEIICWWKTQKNKIKKQES